MRVEISRGLYGLLLIVLGGAVASLGERALAVSGWPDWLTIGLAILLAASALIVSLYGVWQTLRYGWLLLRA